jgi:hypothetical protein
MRSRAVRYLSKLRLLSALFLIALFIMLFASACGIGGDEAEVPPGPPQPAIYAPPENSRVLVNGPLQIHSGHPNGDKISRVELSVGFSPETLQLLRADTPVNGVVVQEWTPTVPGRYTIQVRAIDANGAVASNLTRQIEVFDSQAVASGAVSQAGEFISPEPTKVSSQLVAATPQAVDSTAADAAAAFVVSSTSEVAPAAATPAPPRFPPPPPLPGVPPGPTQAQLPPFTPPVCDAAEYLGVFAPQGINSRRVFVDREDDIAAKAIAGSTVHRAWRLRNIGTCTWGPGYELAFYGGRAMGSGGVAFESSYPADPGRRNALIDANRLIVPEGKPNQTAIIEVLLNIPVTPGVHQSYWRMRNPHGVYFGPIIGVTFEVVRECKFGTFQDPIFGAPVINRFEIVGVGSVYQPNVDKNVPSSIPTVRAKFTEPVTLEWDIINANNFDIVIEDPTGNIQSISTPDNNSRATFNPKTLGLHKITLFADNGVCTFEQQVNVDVIPLEGDQFRLDLILSGSASSLATSNNLSYSAAIKANEVKLSWEHFDQNVDNVTMIAETYRRTFAEYCPGVDSIFGLKFHCSESWSDWRPTGERVVLQVGGETQAAGTATVANVEQKLCPTSFDPSREDYGIKYILQAEANGRAANPEFSNAVDVRCTTSASRLPAELQSTGRAEFVPAN